MTRVTVKRAERLSELLSDVEDALSRASDAVAELTDPDVRGEDREGPSEDLSDALIDLASTVNRITGKQS